MRRTCFPTLALTTASAHAATQTSKTHIHKTVVRDGYRCTVVSSGHHHNLVGHAGDVVCALSGSNHLTAVGSGHVVLIGGKGRDVLRASSSLNSMDTLIGGSGKNTLIAGPSGSDVIQTGTGNDSIDCGSGGAQVTVVGDDPGDTESSDCQGGNVQDASQHWHATVTALATDGSTLTASVSDSSDGAQTWLAAQNPACDLTNLMFDLTTTPASVHVEGGGSLAVGDDVEIESVAGTTNCEPVAVAVYAQPANNNSEDGDVSQHWQGTIGALASNGSTMTVAVSDSSDGAQAWLQAQTPACDPSNLVFDLKSAPASVQVEGGGALAVNDSVEIESTAGSTNCVPVAVTVHAGPADGGGGGDNGGGNGGDGGVFGTVASVNGTSATGTCGVADTTGNFTVTVPWGSATDTVDVTGATTFKAPGTTAPSFADVCVGSQVGAIGVVTSGTVAATWVFVVPAGGLPD